MTVFSHFVDWLNWKALDRSSGNSVSPQITVDLLLVEFSPQKF